MSTANDKKKIHDDFCGELNKQIKQVKKEFDRVETLVTFAHKLEHVGEDINRLQEMKDRRISLVRIKFYHEADVILKEFNNKLRAALDNDDGGRRGWELSGKGNDGGESEADKSAKRTASERKVTRSTSKRLVGKATKKFDQLSKETELAREQAANVAMSRKFLETQSGKKSKESTDSDSEETRSNERKTPVQVGKPRGIVFKHNGQRLVAQTMRPARDEEEKNNKEEDEQKSGADSDVKDGQGVKSGDVTPNGEEMPSEATPQRSLRRRGRERKQTAKARETIDTRGTHSYG